MGERTAFFYGTLMAPPVLFRVIYGSAKPEPWQEKMTTVRPAILESYQRHRVKDLQYPAIIPCQNATVRGSVCTGLTDGDIYRLDIFEGSQYERKKVQVRVLQNVELDEKASDIKPETEEIIEAETYVWKWPVDELLPEEWDFEEFQREKMNAWANIESDDDVEVDEGFADVDRAVAELENDPMGGRGTNGSIGKQLEATRTEPNDQVWHDFTH